MTVFFVNEFILRFDCSLARLQVRYIKTRVKFYIWNTSPLSGFRCFGLSFVLTNKWSLVRGLKRPISTTRKKRFLDIKKHEFNLLFQLIMKIEDTGTELWGPKKY